MRMPPLPGSVPCVGDLKIVKASKRWQATSERVNVCCDN